MNFLFRSGHHDRLSERSRPDALAVCQHRHNFRGLRLHGGQCEPVLRIGNAHNKLRIRGSQEFKFQLLSPYSFLLSLPPLRKGTVLSAVIIVSLSSLNLLKQEK